MNKGTLLAFGFAVSAASPGIAATTLLNFNPAFACGVTCSAGTPISQSYGDAVDVDITYSARTGIGSTPTQGTVNYWPTNYNELIGVAYAGINSSAVIEIRMQVLGNNKLTLNQFWLGSWLSLVRPVALSLFDLNYNPLMATANLLVGPQAIEVNFSFPATTTGLILQIGPDGFNGGIDNLSFTTAPVPEPANWAMLIAGFGLCGAAMRRRRAVVAA